MADFTNPSLETLVICRTVTAFTILSPGPQASPPPGGTFHYESFRDCNHADPVGNLNLFRYWLPLKAHGYRGWRYDMAHGYAACCVGCMMFYGSRCTATGEWSSTATQRPHRVGWWAWVPMSVS